MQREYMGYVNAACKEGMKPEEVQDLFNDIYSKSNTKQGKRVLRLFAKGIGKTKKKSLLKQQQVKQTLENQATPDFQPYFQPEITKEKGYQYILK